MTNIDLKDNTAELDIKYPKKGADFILMKSDLEKYKLLNVTTFNKQGIETVGKESEDKLILKVSTDVNGLCQGTTGNYCGVIYKRVGKDVVKFEISSRFGSTFLMRMLGYANGLYLDDVNFSADNTKKTDQANFVFAFLFIQSLERAAVLGLPRRYVEKKEYEPRLRGQIDIQTYLKKCVPFTGRIATKFREQQIDSDIASVLLKAISIINSDYSQQVISKLSGLMRLLQEHQSSRVWSSEAIKRAKYKTRNIPLFAPFSSAVEYADLIINSYGIKDALENGKTDVSGYLIDVASLFEVYLEKLLVQNLDGWEVHAQSKLGIYDGTFFGGYIYPDLILRNTTTEKVAVFDAKYKVMKMTYRDVDRSDLYQIHTYLSYFGKEVVAGGLLYPIQSEHNHVKAHSDALFRLPIIGSRCKFIVDGVELGLSDSPNIECILSGENAFITRIRNCIEH